MRIVYLSSSLLPSQTANSVHCMKMCRALAQAGHQVELVARKGSATTGDIYGHYGVDPDFRISLLNWPQVRGGGLLYGTDVFRHLRPHRAQIDLVYGRSLYGLQAAAWLELPVIYEVHAPPQNRARLWAERLLFRSPRLLRVVAISKALRDEYLRLFPQLSSRSIEIIVAHDAADPLPEASGVVPLERWPGRPQTPQFGYVGHLYPGKGAELVLQIARYLPDCDFHLVGGTNEDVDYWRTQCTLSNVYFHGFVAHKDVIRYHRAFDVLLLSCAQRVAPSGGTGDIARWMSPIKLFEYMAAGKPIVASDLPVLREVLTDGINCRLADPNNPAAWAEILRELSADTITAHRLSLAARTQFLSQHTWRHRADLVTGRLEIARSA
ncbi:MAG: glycosyltransferase family 4 protein [Deltaproteobacteria bacterium]|nr:glycosyltransferase family 4 protein [Deltaproteobacteria bacterium]